MFAYRVVMDEPVGLCLGFRPRGTLGDDWPVIDKGGDEVFCNGTAMLIVDKEAKWPSEGWEKEGDLLVWRTPDDYYRWLTEYGRE
jgi:hypothetical protein